MTFYHQEQPPSPFPQKNKKQRHINEIIESFQEVSIFILVQSFFSVIEELFLTLDLVLVWMEYYKLFTNEFRNSVNECL